MKLTIPDVPPSPNRVLGKHWSRKAGEKDKWILLVRSQILPTSPMGVPFRRKAKITLHHSRMYDKDNAYAACKPVLDAMKSWRLIWDDAPEFLDLVIEQQKCKHKERHTIIELEEAFNGERQGTSKA